MRIIPFTGVISPQSIEHLTRTLRQDVSPIVFVNSPGGQFEFFSRIGPAIQRRGIITLAGDVQSAAVLLFLLGHTRFAFPESTFLFHEVRVFSHFGAVTVSDVEAFEEYDKAMSDRGRESYQEWRRQMQGAQRWFAEFIGNTVGTGGGPFLNLMQKETVIGAEEALYYGLVHKIVPIELFSQ